MNLQTSLQRALRWASQDTRRWQVASWLGLALALGLVACFGMDAGVSYDEVGLRKYGDMIIAWYTSGFKDASATNFSDLFYYGGLFEAFAQLVVGHLPFGLYESRHLITAFTALLGVVATWQLSARISGPRAGLIGALVLALTPCWSGHGLFNTKDIPFGTAAAFVSVASLRLVFGSAPLRVRDMCLAGVATGVALAVRPGGVFVLSYPCLAAAGRIAIELVRRWRSAERLRPVRLAANLLLCVVLVVVITWPIMLSAWPWAQLKPFENPFAAMRVASHFKWRGSVLFEGRMIKATELPLSYLPVWFRLTLPETYLLAACAGLVLVVGAVVRRSFQPQRALGVALVASCIVLPFTAVLITRPVLYDAQRHMLFLLPPAAALAGCAISECLAASWLPRLGRRVFGAVVGVAVILICVDMAQLHPYEYVYFNRLSGGLRKQYRKFETDYWSVSYREGLEWIVRERLAEAPPQPQRVTTCDYSGNVRVQYYVEQWPDAPARVRITRSSQDADLFLSVRRYSCHRDKGRVLHVVRRQGVPLLYVHRVRDAH